MIRTRISVLGSLFALSSAAWAQTSPDEAVHLRVLPGWVQEDGTQMAAIDLQLAQGWKTYWRVPGDAGIPPRFSWRGARNVEWVKVHWPTPSVFWQSGMRSVGYENRVVLPLTVSRKRPGKDSRLKGSIDIGVCSDICVPVTLHVDTVLPAANAGRDATIAASLAALPYTRAEAGVRAVACSLEPTTEGMQITATLTMPSSGGSEEAVIEPPAAGVWVSDAQTKRQGDRLTITAEMVSYTDDPIFVDRSSLGIMVIGDSYAVEFTGCAE
ncbi:MAG: protein-disulfide reductase DsbD domain-containing protein [Pseudomonadota bacterium]